MKWIFKQLDGDEIEDVTDEILDKLVNGELDGHGTVYCKYSRKIHNGLKFILMYHSIYFCFRDKSNSM